uniref:Large ribosomal subunit protein uL4c n=1 Tax=Mallomonas splendens TaxID=52552 RepID=A0A3G2R050_9STRA|nr:ribosomal protein L4 [Mallomonas splendens]AYO28582.1 ribosomal protein L4 [Mallomonas splendens]
METKIFLENDQRKKKAIGLIHRVYLSQLKNSRKYTASTKTKSEVRGGGKKPWRQKGTGQARAGSIRSPLWVGGGVIFGPKPRLVSKKINKKERRLAILSALYLKKKQFIYINEDTFLDFNQIKTKKICNLIKELNLNFNCKILFILSKPNKYFWLSARNLKTVKISTASCVNLEQILKANYIILSSNSLELINSTYGKQYE